ncbi:MAG: hypothetical protein PWQ17_1006 [Anaerophaga sp.]|nr:hypothetical protein [Anaerophaga sp.]
MKSNQKNILKGGLVAGTLLTATGIRAESASIFVYSE